MFVRRKRVDGRDYYQLVKSERRGGRVRQAVVAHLGTKPTIPEAVAACEKRAEDCLGRAAKIYYDADSYAFDKVFFAALRAGLDLLEGLDLKSLASHKQAKERALEWLENWPGPEVPYTILRVHVVYLNRLAKADPWFDRAEAEKKRAESLRQFAAQCSD